MDREEAIEIIRKNMPSDKSLPVYEALRTLVPELAESEDERMLQTIIRGFENCKRNGMEIFNNTKIDDILVYLEKQKEIGIQWLKSDNVKNPDKPYIDKAGMFYTTDGRMCYASEIGKQKSVEWDEYTKINLDRALQIIKKAKGTLQGYQSDDGIYECDKAIECLEHFLYRGLEIEKHTECIEFANEFDSQISHLLVSVLNGEHEYNKDFVKYAAQSLLGYAKNELKSDELNEREKLMKALQTSNAQIGELVEENYKLKEQKPVEIDEYEIIKKHITEDVLSSEVNKRLKECGWYVTEEPVKWEEEDQKSLNRAINICISDFGEDCQTAKFLKSLPERFNLQPKQEWNEEDEKRLELVIDCVYEYYPDPVMKYKLKDWLNSLPLNLKKKNEDVEKLCSNEWSEEDQKIYDDIMSALEKSLNANRCYFTSDDVIFLKSLPFKLKKENEGWKHYIWATNLRFDFTALIKYDNTDDYEIVQAGNRPKQEKNGIYILIKDIESQPHWKPSEEQPEVDLEKEIETYFKGWYMDETNQGYILHTPDDHAGLMSVKQIARHFYELGLKARKEE